MYKRKGKGKGKARGKGRSFKPKRSMKRGVKSDYATLTTTIEDTININQGLSYGFRLNNYERAMEVAHAYKYYRAKKVEVMFVPYSNISQIGGVAASRLPQLYKTVDRVVNMNIAPVEGEMLERGVKPVLFNKLQRLAFKPNLLQLIQLVSNQPADGGNNPLGINVLGAENSYPIFDKWLPTQQSFGHAPGNNPATNQQGIRLIQNAVNPYDIWYYGVTFLASQENAVPGTPCGDIQIRVTWEFKGARSTCLSGNPSELPVGDNTTISGITPGYVPNTQPSDYGKPCGNGAPSVSYTEYYTT